MLRFGKVKMGLFTFQFNLAVVFQLFILYCSASNVIVYENNNKVGKNVSINMCSNLNQFGIHDVNSVDLDGNCVRLYDKENCFGNFVELYEHVPELKSISQWKKTYLKDEAKSTGPCPNPCYQQFYGQKPTVEIFNATNYNGSSQNVVLEGCFGYLDNKFPGIKSIRTNNNCVRIYSNPSCQIDGAVPEYFELRPGTPYHNDLEKWDSFYIKSISLCSHICKNIDSDMPEQYQVFLFSEFNFKGTMTKPNISKGMCSKVSESGNKLPRSIKVGDKTCVNLYSEGDCTGTEYEVKASVYYFNISTKSIADCYYVRSDPTTINPLASTSTVNSFINHSLTGNIGEISVALSTSTIAIISTAVCIGLLVLALAVMCLKNKLFIRVREKIAEKDVKGFFDGIDISVETTTENAEETSTEMIAKSKPYNKQFDILRSRIDYEIDKLLRKSDLDLVYEGTMAENSGIRKRLSMIQTMKKVPVTIKVANRAAGLQGLQSLMQEIKVMMYLGQHENIAHMVGCCTENIRQGKLLVIMEFCANGTLESYLLINRQLFLSQMEKNSNANSSKSVSINIGSSTAITGQPQFNTLLLLQWCIDVSRGMEFLSKANIAHSDLAARNILLTNTLQAKISDFGLSRQMYCYSKSVHTQQEPLPWRWMAIESILQLKFTTKSDVWSYGVLCWEIFTLGQMPFEEIRSKDAYISQLEEGFRLKKPKNVNYEFYTLLLTCWEYDPKRRHNFTGVTKRMEDQLLLYT